MTGPLLAEDEGNPEEQDKKEYSFGFTPEGQFLGYISLEEAMIEASVPPGTIPATTKQLLRQPHGVQRGAARREGRLLRITLTKRPEGDFEGQPRQEQFFIEKEGSVARQQALILPRAKVGGFPNRSHRPDHCGAYCSGGGPDSDSRRR